jgi:hypothetical protein
MTGIRSQRSMKRGSTPTPVCSELQLFSREAITLRTPRKVNERYRDLSPTTPHNGSNCADTFVLSRHFLPTLSGRGSWSELEYDAAPGAVAAGVGPTIFGCPVEIPVLIEDKPGYGAPSIGAVDRPLAEAV